MIILNLRLLSRKNKKPENSNFNYLIAQISSPEGKAVAITKAVKKGIDIDPAYIEEAFQVFRQADRFNDGMTLAEYIGDAKRMEMIVDEQLHSEPKNPYEGLNKEVQHYEGIRNNSLKMIEAEKRGDKNRASQLFISNDDFRSITEKEALEKADSYIKDAESSNKEEANLFYEKAIRYCERVGRFDKCGKIAMKKGETEREKVYKALDSLLI